MGSKPRVLVQGNKKAITEWAVIIKAYYQLEWPIVWDLLTLFHIQIRSTIVYTL